MNDDDNFDDISLADIPDLEDGEPGTHVVKPAALELKGLAGKDLILALQKMSPGHKRVLAMKGMGSVRRILLRDPNYDVQLAIVASPKSSESEIEQLASFATTGEVVLKTIGNDGRWMRSYRIKRALALNPKTPMALVTRCLRALTPHDLKKIAVDPNVRRLVAQAANQMVATRR